MSAAATAWVWNHSPYKGVAFTIHLAVADVANDMNGNRVWASAATIAAKARTTRETVTRTLATMADDGLIRLLDPDALAVRKSRHLGREFEFLMPQTDVTSDHIELGHEAIRCDEGSHRDVTSDHIHDVTSDHIQGTQEETEDGTQGEPPTPLPPGGGESAGLSLVTSAPASLPEPQCSPSAAEVARQVLRQRRPSAAEVARQVLAAWVAATGRDPARSRMNDKRRKKIGARLAEGYPPEDLIAAVQGIALSPWHMGDNPAGKRYDDIVVALRDGSQVEKFRDLFEAGGATERRTGADIALAAMQSAGLA